MKAQADATISQRAIRVVKADPGLLLLELAWRWCFALGVLGVMFVLLRRIHDALVLSGWDNLRSSAHDPIAFVQSLAVVLLDAVSLLAPVLLLAVLIAGVMWAIAATLGRALITNILVSRIGNRAAVRNTLRWPALFAVHFARVLALLILFIGYIAGAFAGAAALGPESQPNVLASTMLFLLVFALFAAAWSYSNWVLSLAVIYVVRDGRSALDATAEAVYFTGRQRQTLVSFASANATARTLVGIAVTVITITAVWAAASTAVLAFSIGVVLTVVYCIASDWLLLVRLAGYVAIAEADRRESPSVVPPNRVTEPAP